MFSPLLTIMLLFAIHAGFSSVGLMLLKQSMSRIRAGDAVLLSMSANTAVLFAGFCLYVISFAVWLRIMSRLPISTAYPISIGLTMVMTTTGAVLLLGERLGPLKLAGLLFIFIGCVSLSWESR